jgi:hypothetical protein
LDFVPDEREADPRVLRLAAVAAEPSALLAEDGDVFFGFDVLAFSSSLGSDAALLLGLAEGEEPVGAALAECEREAAVVLDLVGGWAFEDPPPVADDRPAAFFFAVGMSVSLAGSVVER